MNFMYIHTLYKSPFLAFSNIYSYAGKISYDRYTHILRISACTAVSRSDGQDRVNLLFSPYTMHTHTSIMYTRKFKFTYASLPLHTFIIYTHGNRIYNTTAIIRRTPGAPILNLSKTFLFIIVTSLYIV